MSDHKDRRFKPLSDTEVTELLAGACDVYMETGKMPRELAKDRESLMTFVREVASHARSWEGRKQQLADFSELTCKAELLLARLKGGN